MRLSAACLCLPILARHIGETRVRGCYVDGCERPYSQYNPANVRVLGDKTRGPRATHSPSLVPCKLLGLYRSKPFNANQAARSPADYRCAQYFFCTPTSWSPATSLPAPSATGKHFLASPGKPGGFGGFGVHIQSEQPLTSSSPVPRRDHLSCRWPPVELRSGRSCQSDPTGYHERLQRAPRQA